MIQLLASSESSFRFFNHLVFTCLVPELLIENSENTLLNTMEVSSKNEECELCLFRRLDKLTRDTVYWMDCLDMKTQVNFVHEIPCIELESKEGGKRSKASMNEGSLVLLSKYLAFYSESHKYTIDEKTIKSIFLGEENTVKVETNDGKLYRFKFYIPGQSREIGLLLCGLYNKELESRRRSYESELEELLPVFHTDWLSLKLDGMFNKLFEKVRLFIISKEIQKGSLIWKEQFKITEDSVVTFILRKGTLRVFKVDSHFEQIQIVDVPPNEFLSFKPFEETKRMLPFTIKAITDVEIDVVPQNVMRLISLQDACFAPNFCYYMGFVFCRLFGNEH
eukprot:TRINITY_DN6777_c0_g1_i4.p1 TRINITY_DN6777_c0_g1~~TRINITY_DN6777_c0_g1_i4.p1  ORF type:complete len:336 (-),score=72.74 TRINITY_DN6777_c0_g1_i4:307-1314(-)